MSFTPSKKKAQSYSDFFKGSTQGAQVGSDSKMPPFARTTTGETRSKIFKNKNPFQKNTDDEENKDDSLVARRKAAIERRLKGKKGKRPV